MNDAITQEQNGDGIDRRGFLEYMAWVGPGLAWSVSGGLLSSRALGQAQDPASKADFTFVQISDSHIGFSKPPNQDVAGTLQQTMAKINALPTRPDLVIHTDGLSIDIGCRGQTCARSEAGHPPLGMSRGVSRPAKLL